MKGLPRTVLLSLLTLAIVGLLVWFGDARKVLALIGRFDRIYLAWFAAVLIAHEFVRWLVWAMLLSALGLRLPWRAQFFAFAVGESAKFVPTGAYVQNYLLHRSTGADFGRTSAATTLIMVAEIVVALIAVLILGVGSISTWLRLAVLVAVLVVAIAGVLFYVFPHIVRLPRRLKEHRIVRALIGEWKQFRAGTARLLHPSVIVMTLVLSAIYVGLAGADMYLVVSALGVNATFWQCEAVYCFGLGFYVVLGSLEAADVGAFLAIGVSRSAAVTTILVTRVLSVGMTLALTAITIVVLQGELRQIWRRTPEPVVQTQSPQAQP